MRIVRNRFIIMNVGESHTLTKEDVGRILPSDFGRVQAGDVGKRIYMKECGLVMENNEQRDARLRLEAKPNVEHTTMNGRPVAILHRTAEVVRSFQKELEDHKNVAARSLMDQAGEKLAGSPFPAVSVGDLLTDPQLHELATVLGELKVAKIKPLDPRFTDRLKELFRPWKDDLEAKGILPDFLAYAVAYGLSKK